LILLGLLFYELPEPLRRALGGAANIGSEKHPL
jgi:hypothetical protein